VSADQFRFGPLQLALSQLSEKTAPQDPPLTLSEAVSTAADQVRQLDDPNAGLGPSLVLLITTDSLNDDLATLESLAHRNAIEGIFLSVINIGQLAVSHAVQQLVLLGQGNRRLLTRPDEAPGLIERELYAASRAVARALRLRIHLQPGVQLIDILGSHRLDEPEAQRVREAEQSIDQRLQRNLGIQADRGEDEEGIQIVIPHFYAGDSHVILLDVVAERSGPIAQVSARYKDLVTLDNAVVHAQLTLDDGDHTAGPVQRIVLKNMLAFEFCETTRQAAGQLMAGQQQQAVSGLTALRQLFYGMSQAVPVWSNDRELLRDTQLLSDYLAQLNAPSQNPQPWADALRYVAFRKLIPAEESL
jgi:hypothetical protein